MGRAGTAMRAVWPNSTALRVLIATSLVRSLGTGIVVTLSTLYFVRKVHLSPAEVGLALSCAAVAALLAGYPSGLLSDAIGARRLSIISRLLCGASIVSYLVVRDFVSLLIAAALYAVLNAIGGTASAALVGSVLEPAERVQGRAVMRVVSNLGVSVGAVIAGLVLRDDSASVYNFALLGSGVASGGSALLYLMLPARPGPVRPPHEAPAQVLRDRPYLALTALSAVLATNDALLFVALPLWISTRTNAPAWTFSSAVFLNSALVILLQIRLARMASTIAGCARAMRWSGLALAASCAVWGLASGCPAYVAVSLVLAGAVLHVLGELLQSAGSWGLSYDLAPEHACGQYQGLFGTGVQLAGVVTPVIAGGFLIRAGLPAWLLFALALLAAGLLTPAVTTWAERTRLSAPTPSR